MTILIRLLLCLLLSSTFIPLAAKAQVLSPAQSTEPVVTKEASTIVEQSDVLITNDTDTAVNSDQRLGLSDTSFDSHDLSPWGMYKAADVVVKAVIIGLLITSVISWAICIFKTVQLKVASRNAEKLLKHLINSESFANANQGLLEQKNPDNDVLMLVDATRHELQLTSSGVSTDDALKERIVARLERVQASLCSRINKGTGVLATIGAVAPFVGLFGTVWGIMNSFIGIAKTQTTNLAVVAPGIAEALLATALGLVAAIPAVVIYNHFSRAISSYKMKLADIVTAIMILISRDLDRYHPQATPLADIFNYGHAQTYVSS